MSGGEVREQPRLGPLGERLLDVSVWDLEAYTAYERRRSDSTERLQALESELAAAVAMLARPLVELLAAGTAGEVTDAAASGAARLVELLALIDSERLALAADAEREHSGQAGRFIRLGDLTAEAIHELEGDNGLLVRFGQVRDAYERTAAFRSHATRQARKTQKYDGVVKMTLEGRSQKEIAVVLGCTREYVSKLARLARVNGDLT